MGPDPALNQREIAKFSPRDAEAYPRTKQLLERVAGVIEPVLMQTAPDPLPHAQLRGERSACASGCATPARCGRSTRPLGQLGDDMPEAIELLTGAVRPILDRWFETDVLKATLATDAIIGAIALHLRARAAPTCCCTT